MEEVVIRDRNQAVHIREYLSRKCFPDLPKYLTPLWCGDATDVTVGLSCFVEGFMQLSGRCLHKLNDN